MEIRFLTCERCAEAGKKLEEFIQKLIEEIPGTEVEGHPVPKGHHVTHALNVLAEKYLAQELMEMLQMEVLNNPAPQRSLSGNKLPEVMH